MTNGRATIKDVAREANVTAQTVSRVFRGQSCVTQKTKEAVWAAAKKLNYVPNKTAIMLRKGNPNTIAVVFDSLRNIYFAIMIDYLNAELSNRGYEMMPIFVNKHVTTADIYRSAISSGALAVVSFLEPTDDVEEAVKAFGVPFMVFGRRSDLLGVDYLMTDDECGGHLAAKCLIEAGCDSFVFVGGGFGMSCVIDRLKGFTEELALNGFDAKIVHFYEWEEGDKAENEKIEKANGIFCFQDIMAYKILEKFSHSDKKVVGYDDLQSDINFPVHLTTLGVDKVKYISHMVDLLFDKLNGKISEFHEKYPVELYKGTTA